MNQFTFRFKDRWINVRYNWTRYRSIEFFKLLDGFMFDIIFFTVIVKLKK